ncbi:MAG: cytochrome c biogenesis CcdA family protein [Candidatus Margulisbacteria bacterium]|jgi:cytochrome c-type biogenesis protein|nr:cytochrome c biogenesis CcdA family protein [Candidatus Margulisiibacteriota bacterium]
MNNQVSLGLSFTAGLLSFFSPCVLPLLPSYLCLLGGFTPEQLKQDAPPLNGYFLSRTLGFICGFSLVFIALSLLFASGFSLLGGAALYIRWLAGLVIIALGLNILFDFLAFLNYEKRFHFARWPRGTGGALLAGLAFGAGWTPCIGPILASILLLAGQSGQAGAAALYLTAYSAGLGLPFLLAALFLERFWRVTSRLRTALPIIQKISGVLLIVIGLLVLTGHLQALTVLLNK